jgi:DNA-binding response OmpR family regulator
MATVLIAEDEQRIREFLSLYFRAEHYEVLEAATGQEAIESFDHNQVDLAIIDVMMPDVDGFEVCRHIRKKSLMPVIILTALEEEEQHLQGFAAGADDYLTKPVKIKVLLYKAERLLQSKQMLTDSLVIDQLEIDKVGRKIIVNNKEVYFAPKEFEILLLLAENKGKALSREYIINHVWDYYYVGGTRIVDNHIKKIRNKLGTMACLIKTVISFGYKLEDS